MKKTRKKTTSHLLSNRGKSKINSPMRKLILKRVKQLGLSRYEVAKAVAPHMSAQAVYDFLAARRDMTSGYLFHLLEALGLEVTIRRMGQK